jgi:hypothetical protein
MGIFETLNSDSLELTSTHYHHLGRAKNDEVDSVKTSAFFIGYFKVMNLVTFIEFRNSLGDKAGSQPFELRTLYQIK